MKFTYALIGLCIGSGSVSASSFSGQIVQIVTGTNDPHYQTGEIFFGSYFYHSPTADGTFTTPPLNEIGGENTSLGGIVFLTFASKEFSGDTQLVNTVNEGRLTVKNGVVDEFLWTWEKGGYYAWFGTQSFFTTGKYDQEQDPVYTTSGDLRFAPPVVVAERGNILPYFISGLVCLAMAALRRNVKAASL